MSAYTISVSDDTVSVIRHREHYLDATIAQFTVALGFPIADAVGAAETLVASLEERGDYA